MKSKLQARDLILSGLEKSYNENIASQEQMCHSCSKDRGIEITEVNKIQTSKDPILCLRKTVLLQEMQNAGIRRLQVLVQKLGERESENISSPSSSSLSPSCTQNGEKEHGNTNLSIVVSLSDKLSLLHEYLKVSLHLLECKLSNDVESLSSTSNPDLKVELDAAINVRFEQMLESLQAIEKEMILYSKFEELD